MSRVAHRFGLLATGRKRKATGFCLYARLFFVILIESSWDDRMFFEHRSDPLLPFHLWMRRVVKSVGLAAVIVAVSLGTGVLGYHAFGHLPWIDALLEASMILGGEGPIATMNNDAVKLFASAYALFSGLVLLSTMGILLAPWLHRMMHKFHCEERKKRR
jgi:hypothetical protein